ncbi:unnamed protein product [Pylaiella littoralis]
MSLSLERGCVEAVFLVALAAVTAIIHYAHGFTPAFASFSTAAFAANSGPLYNYVCLLVAAAAAYTTARTAASYTSAAISPPPPPPSSSSSGAKKIASLVVAARRTATALLLPVVAVIGCYAGAGYPSLGGTVAGRWLSANWERNGERDLWWCGRLFVLLLCWQAALTGVITTCGALAGGVSRKVASALGSPAGAARDGKRPKQQRQPQPSGSTSSSSSSTSSTSSGGSGKSSVVVGESNGAPRWER